ncbi:hypothetical protein B7P43_G11248 [Cryptotermes secundus]|uniref:Vitellogenin domain-containing protein n=1 Tax=Cryptotermes secundus TaxID=105785 RepID=A0A2J7R0V8_9NEOP|nr:hypothetical protein B7P43_G11248 [Cryptotermes secundus]
MRYLYNIQSRALTGLHQVADQYAGILMEARLAVEPQSEELLRAQSEELLRAQDRDGMLQLLQPMYAKVHSILPEGWAEEIDDRHLSFNPMPIKSNPFEIRLDSDGLVKELLVSRQTTESEANMLKGIVSQFQLNTQAVHLITHRQNHIPGPNSDSALYSVMESAVTGECEVLYDVSSFPEAIIRAQPELAPLDAKGSLIQIIKSQNFSNCNRRRVYHFGFSDSENIQPGGNVGNLVARSSLSRVVISGSLNKFIIQSSVTTNRVFLSLEVSNDQKGMSASRVNVTIESITKTQKIPSLRGQRSVGDLVYRFNSHDRHLSHFKGKSDSGYTSDTDSSRSSSEEDTTTQRSNDPRKSQLTGKEANMKDQDDSGELLWKESKRTRRSMQAKIGASGNKSYSSSSSSSGSRENEEQTELEVDSAPCMPLIPSVVGIQESKLRASKQIDPVRTVVKIATKIGSELEKPCWLVEDNTLSKFTLMTRVLRTMDSKQIDEATRTLEPSSPTNPNLNGNIKWGAWKSLRDSVAQTGTLPALSVIADLIRKDKILGNDAAEVVALLSRSALTPTPAYLDMFFELVKDPKVREQPFLNLTAVISFSTILREVAVNTRTATVRYPVYVFGRMVPKHFTALTEKYIPYLGHELHKAITEGNSPKIQLHILALGNIAHPNILQYLEPYLEGRIGVSKFQRLLMVCALMKLTKMHPEVASPILLKLYENLGEAYEIRTAAVFLLMETKPSETLLQRMAEFSNFDTSKHVIAAVHSAIKSAPNLEEPFTFRTSRKTTNLKKPGTKRNNEETATIPDIANENMEQVEGNFMFFHAGSDRVFPFDYHTLQNIPVLMRDMARKYRNPETFNYTKIYYRDNIMLEFPNAMGLPFIFTLRTPTLMKMAAETSLRSQPDLAHGSDRKVVIPESVNVTADAQFVYNVQLDSMLGFVTPFDNMRYIAGLDRNMLFHIPVKANVDVDVLKRKLTINVMPGRNRRVTLTHLRTRPYTSTHDIFNMIPVLEDSSTKVIHVRPTRKSNMTFGQQTGVVFHLQSESEEEFSDFKSQLDSAQMPDAHSKLYFNNIAHDILYEDTRLTYDPQRSTANVVKITAVYDTDVEDEDDSNTENGSAHLKNQKSPLPRSVNRKWQNTQESGPESINPANPEPYTAPNCRLRRKKFLSKAAARAGNATASVIDLSITFEGQTKAVFLMTAASASSPVNGSGSLLVFMTSQPAQHPEIAEQQLIPELQVCLFGDVSMPQVPIINFSEALKFNPNSSVRALLNFGETCNNGATVMLNGQLELTNKRQKYIADSPMAKLCESQMMEGNYLLPACRIATESANNLDQYRLKIALNNVTEFQKNNVYILYNMARDLLRPYITENAYPQNTRDVTVHVTANLNEQSTALNMTMETPLLNVNVTNVRLSKLARSLLNINPAKTVMERIGRTVSSLYYEPSCVLDTTEANTFDNRTYPLELGNCWYVMMMLVPKLPADHTRPQNSRRGLNRLDRVTVLVKAVGHKKKVKVLLSSATLDLQPVVEPRPGPAVQLSINSKPVLLTSSHATELRDDGELLGLVYEFPSGAVQLTLPNNNLVLVYDGARVMLQASNEYSHQVRGLCGTFDGEPFTDFKTPRNCLVTEPSILAATYAIDDNSCEAPVRNMKKNASEELCVQERSSFADVIANGQPKSSRQRGIQINQSVNDSSSFSSSESISDHNSNSNYEVNLFPLSKRPSRLNNKISRHNPKHVSNSISYKTVIITDNEESCFSKNPLPACTTGYHITATVKKYAPFFCTAERHLAERYIKLVNNGFFPDFRLHKGLRPIAVLVAAKCELNPTA